MMMPAAIDMLPSPAVRADMREGTWLELEGDVRACNCSDCSESPPRFLLSHPHTTNTRWLAVQSNSRAMPFEKTLHDLFEQPFGPYLEETILSDKCKSTGSKRLLLRDFQLSYNDEPTG
jgi:hypothetical protein